MSDYIASANACDSHAEFTHFTLALPANHSFYWITYFAASIQYVNLEYKILQYITIQYSSIECNSMQYNAIQYNFDLKDKR